jgi:hypothetical protein
MHGNTNSFVVRIWHEAVDSEGKVTAWRGSIEHVGSARRLYFQDLDHLVTFIQDSAGVGAQAQEEGTAG